jgi:hypothetical protein
MAPDAVFRVPGVESDACPHWTDEQQYLRKIYFALRPSSSVADMLERCGYRGGRLELLSCLACFVGDKAWDVLEKSTRNVELWRHTLRKYFQKHNISPHPSVLMKEL